MSARSQPVAAALAVLAAIAVVAGFSFYQVGSPIFACGRRIAGPEIHLWMALAAVQAVAYLMAGWSEPWRAGYRVLQYLTLPLAAIPLAQLAIAYPGTFVALALPGLAYAYAMSLRGALFTGGAVRAPFAPGTALVETTVFLLATVVLHSALAFLVLHTPGLALSNGLFVALLAASAVIVAWILRHDTPAAALAIEQVPPLALLAVVLLRAKLPDAAYDSLFYKATLPIMIADWRTAVTGAMDHAALLGTNFQEIIDSQLRIADAAYPPALTSTLAFLALWVVAPAAAAAVLPGTPAAGRTLARNVLGLLLVSLTEPLVAAGTAYQEPLLALLLVGSLLPLSLAWLFLAAAVAVKVTALFVVPIIVVVKCWPPSGWRGLLGGAAGPSVARRLALAACLVLAVLTTGEQFYRNYAYTGRLTGITETLAGLTDPGNRVLAAQSTDPIEPLRPHGLREKYVNTFVHVLTLDRWIKPSPFGFHVIPSSRLPALALVLVVLVLAFRALRRDRILLATCAAWMLCALVLLTFVWQGRYLLPLSFGSALVAALLVDRIGRETGGAPGWSIAFALAAAALAFGDQLVGSYVNDGWECRRNLLTGVVKNDYDRPTTALERRLAGIAERYRAATPRRDVIPTILCENSVERSRYLGAHYIYAYMAYDLNLRRLAARPDLASTLPTSLLAICSLTPHFADPLLTPATRAQFEAVDPVRTEDGHTVYILVSKPLLAGAAATTLAGRGMDPLGWLRPSTSDFVAAWGPGHLTSMAPADAPGGHGALVMESGGAKVAVLIAPFSVAFEGIDYAKGGRLHAELAMPYSASDGMGVDFTFQGADGARATVSIAVGAKPAGSDALSWETKGIPVPPAIRGVGTLTIAATSPSGNSNADWVFFRALRLERSAP